MGLDIVLEAMDEELHRSKKLKIEGYKEKPYFISYLAKEIEEVSIESSHGCLDTSEVCKSLEVMATVHVGSYKEDGVGIAFVNLPLPDLKKGDRKKVKQAIKTKLWSITDSAFKQALTDFFSKKSQDVERVVDDKAKIADFSREDPHKYLEKDKELVIETTKWQEILRKTSNEIMDYKNVLGGSVSFLAKKEKNYFLSTEGTRLRHQNIYYNLLMEATTRGIDLLTKKEDGSVLLNVKTYDIGKYKDLPTPKQLITDVEQLVNELMMMREAERLTPGVYPAIIYQCVHGFLWHEVIGHRLESQSVNEAELSNPFEGRLGEKITKEFITIEMDPTKKEYKGKFLNGQYKFDDEGVPAQKVTLIKKGVLQNFLTTRKPIKPMNGKQFIKSNGHGRIETIGYEPVARMSTLVIKSDNEVSYEELKKKLIHLCVQQKKPYGLIIYGASGGETDLVNESFVLYPSVAYKIDARTGKETPIRGFEINGTSLSILENIVATDNNYEVAGGYCGAESGLVPTAEVAPRALINNLEVKKASEEKSRGPIIPPP
ncbi:hypothetical protein HY643_03540 [Candidatus Woesearchaeota archaeon]|nr:hypothetical protein [Candidatus Woesearchaeota archaeon]